METADFSSLTRQRVRVVAPGGRKYVLMEAEEEAIIAWRNSQHKHTKLDGVGKVVSLEGIAASRIVLIAGCLHNATWVDDKPGEELGDKVSVEELKHWLTRVVEKLFELLKEMSDLNSKEDSDEDRDAVLGAFSREDSPVKLVVVREWAKGLMAKDPKRYRPFYELVRDSEDSNAKNLQSATPDTSA